MYLDVVAHLPRDANRAAQEAREEGDLIACEVSRGRTVGFGAAPSQQPSAAGRVGASP